MSSEEDINMKGLLDISNTSKNENMTSSDDFAVSKSKENNAQPTFSQEYFDEIYENLLLDEARFNQKVNSNYMSFQKSINYKMRAILVDWIIDVHNRCNMKKKTLFQTIFIIDAFLSKSILDKKDFQLLGMAALLIASKETEIIFPSLNTFLALSNFAYTKEELIEMERDVIKRLKFDILAPTAEEFFEINAEYFEFTQEQKYFGEYFLDSSLIDYNLLKYKQSTIAVACGYIVMKFYKLNGVHLMLDNSSFDVNQKEVKNCARELCFLIKNLSNSSLGAAKNKYM
jgi:cyclin B